nr:MAG TPA: hypothetical protein [Caudoviricetes sp.]
MWYLVSILFNKYESLKIIYYLTSIRYTNIPRKE